MFALGILLSAAAGATEPVPLCRFPDMPWPRTLNLRATPDGPAFVRGTTATARAPTLVQTEDGRLFLQATWSDTGLELSGFVAVDADLPLFTTRPVSAGPHADLQAGASVRLVGAQDGSLRVELPVWTVDAWQPPAPLQVDVPCGAVALAPTRPPSAAPGGDRRALRPGRHEVRAANDPTLALGTLEVTSPLNVDVGPTRDGWTTVELDQHGATWHLAVPDAALDAPVTVLTSSGAAAGPGLTIVTSQARRSTTDGLRYQERHACPTPQALHHRSEAGAAVVGRLLAGTSFWVQGGAVDGLVPIAPAGTTLQPAAPDALWVEAAALGCPQPAVYAARPAEPG